MQEEQIARQLRSQFRIAEIGIEAAVGGNVEAVGFQR